LRDLDSAQRLVAVQPERPLNPASNQKLITAIAAVELLGADYRFETSVSRSGDALILRGSGDPDLHTAQLHALASAILAEPGALDGVRRLIIDDTAFSPRRLGPGFQSDGPGLSYMAPSGALAIDFATVTVTLRPVPGQRAAAVSVSPPGAAFEVHNHALTRAGARGIPGVRTRAGEHGATIIEIQGTLAPGRAPVVVRRRVSDPGMVAGAAFAAILTELGGPHLPVSRRPRPDSRGWAPTDARLLATHRSRPLVDVLRSALRYSNNFTAEQVLRTLAWRASGEAGSWEAGVAVLERFALALSPTRAEDQRFVNGSGLSRKGRISAAFLLDALGLAQRPGSPSQALLASFAEAGGEGTLRSRLAFAGPRVLAKTGTYAGASTLTGLVYDRAGIRAVGFSILVNGADLQASHTAQDTVVTALLRALD